MKIPALLVGVEYARVVVLIKTINAIAIAIVRNFLIKIHRAQSVDLGE